MIYQKGLGVSVNIIAGESLECDMHMGRCGSGSRVEVRCTMHLSAVDTHVVMHLYA